MSSAQPNVVLEYNKETSSVVKLVVMMWSPCLIVNVMITIDQHLIRTALQHSVQEFGLPVLLERLFCFFRKK